ncbi:MAG: TIM barrel protein [Firmicutes bacterium]|nr:TIM barrel protein [Bacillota bacterium]
MRSGPFFGAGGNSDNFYAEGHKSSLDACEYLARLGLTAYEYECTHGVRLSDAFCAALGHSARQLGIALSVHAPYYINLSSEDDTVRQKSLTHITKALRAADKMGAERVVFHPGTLGRQSREAALERAAAMLEEIVSEVRREGLLDNVYLCPETMGKKNLLGTLPEVLRLCEVDARVRPTIDFAHIHALTGGGLRGRQDFVRILDAIDAALGEEALQRLHVHFSPIEYTAAGEKKHRTLCDKEYGPDFELLAGLIAENGWQPTIICESAGTQDEDAVVFRNIYDRCYHMWRQQSNI